MVSATINPPGLRHLERRSENSEGNSRRIFDPIHGGLGYFCEIWSPCLWRDLEPESERFGAGLSFSIKDVLKRNFQEEPMKGFLKGISG